MTTKDLHKFLVGFINSSLKYFSMNILGGLSGDEY